jgi:hypothetical protein
MVAGIGERNGAPFSFVTYTLYAFPMMVVLCRDLSRVYLVALFLRRARRSVGGQTRFVANRV